MYKAGFGLILTFLMLACSPDSQPVPDEPLAVQQPITGARIRQHMEILSDDDMQGREAGTQGYQRAANYVAEQFETAGLQGGGDEGSFFQQIEFLETRLQVETARLAFGKGDETLDFQIRDDYVMSGSYGDAQQSVSAPLVFVGHGIIAPEYEHDDFNSVDVSGKILVVLSGAPPHFGTDQRAFYSSSSGKKRLAAERGALGIIVVRTPVDQARRPWTRYLPGLGTAGMRWLHPDGTPDEAYPELKGLISLSDTGAVSLFEFSGHDLETLFVRHAQGATGSFDMGVSASISSESSQSTVSSSNVVAVLQGSDPELASQYVVYSAHLDHIGIRPGKDGDDLHNGTYDNAAGIAAIIEIATAMANLPAPPRRSVMFVAVTAEEKGLQGSSYFASNPPVARQQLVANINIDMPYLGFPVADVHAFGAEHSSLLAQVERATAEQGLELTPDPMPEQVRFIRSDQFSFVKKGIPALAFKAGSKSSDPDIDGPAMLKDFLDNHYHQASDDLNLPYSSLGAERFVRAGYTLGLIVANDENRPRWNENDFFGEKFVHTE